MLIAFALVCFTWNPTRYNYIAWARAQEKPFRMRAASPFLSAAEAGVETL